MGPRGGRLRWRCASNAKENGLVRPDRAPGTCYRRSRGLAPNYLTDMGFGADEADRWDAGDLPGEAEAPVPTLRVEPRFARGEVGLLNVGPWGARVAGERARPPRLRRRSPRRRCPGRCPASR